MRYLRCVIMDSTSCGQQYIEIVPLDGVTCSDDSVDGRHFPVKVSIGTRCFRDCTDSASISDQRVCNSAIFDS